MAERDRLVRGYAEAVLAVAEAEGTLDSVEDELYRFARTVERQTDLRDALTDPGLPADRKKAVIQDLLGARANPQTVGLLGFLVEQGLARDLTRVVDTLAELAAERRQRSLAEVRTAGFDCACAAFSGLARRGADVFQLPRPMVLDWDGDELAKRLRGWFAWY